MSSKTADPVFLLQKKIEKRFANHHPDLWVPAYSRVTFSDQPYAEALSVGDAQEAIMAEVMKLPDISENWKSKEVEDFILEKLTSGK